MARLFHRLCQGCQRECLTPASMVRFLAAFQLSWTNQSNAVATHGVTGLPPSSAYSLKFPMIALAIAKPVVFGFPASRKRNMPFSLCVAGGLEVVNWIWSFCPERSMNTPHFSVWFRMILVVLLDQA